MTTDGWDVAGIVEATRDHRLTRKCVVTHGNCGAWAASAGTSEGNSQNMPNFRHAQTASYGFLPGPKG